MRKAGSIVLDRLRERILLGRYFGCWSPGDRLPSVRDVAELEDVDRKTAAAAYRRLEREGLVVVEPRSGVYLSDRDAEEGGDPLRRLHRQWLDQTLTAAAELGLDSASATRMLQAVAAVESRRIPVVDDDGEHACLMARELTLRTGLDCAGCRPQEVPAPTGPLKEAPFIIATPSVSTQLKPAQRQVPVVRATLAPGLLEEVRQRARAGVVTVLVGTEGLKRELAQALDHGLAGPRSRVRVERPANPVEVDRLRAGGAAVLVWPGAPDWAAERLNGQGSRPAHLLSDDTLREIRRQVARAAVEVAKRSGFSRSSVA